MVIPTYNESDNIEPLVSRLLELPLALDVIVVDDNSPDGTGDLLDAMAARDSRLLPIHREAKLGLGSAHIRGFKAALDRSYQRVLSMDADFSHDPKHIPAMIALGESRDVVIGSRYVPGGGTRHCTLARRALSRTANAFARAALGLQASDCTAGFRCYRRQVLENIDLGSILADGYSFLIEMLYRVQARGFSVGEVPIVFEDRRLGASKISRREIGLALATVFRLAASRGRAKS